MKKTTSIIFSLIFFYSFAFAQKTKNQTEEAQIKQTCINFLKWHKAGGEEKLGEKYFVPRYDGKDSVKTYFDRDSLETYFNNFRNSGFTSELYIGQLKEYFKYYEKFIGKEPKKGELIKIDGLDKDIVLNTFEPEEILENLRKFKITKILIIYNKALVGINFKKNVDMIFQLTKGKDKWLIDYVWPDNTSINSFFRY
ncbi:hypothetical protein IDJ75_03215 [Mucilaginibacter rigui]|uniref:DUF3828 domain-containing protein n=1 Tax=Mucilaginibacter rigui TaxID=534635 RepID=A0ABR7X2Q0_9SPHI|nr:hypothetical protein [Mucilaginibacter rigui]MBD1384275.1 hypothetical protein [Mucilaginibacter rigui]